MEVIDIKKNNFKEVIEIALNTIKKDGVIVTPSETQYGLSVDPSSKEATQKIYSIKGRDFNKPLPLVAGDIEIVNKYFNLNEPESKVATKFWPGALGLLLTPKSDELIQKIAKLTLGGLFDINKPTGNKMIVRVTSDEVLNKLSKGLGLPIVSTSANLAGQEPCYNTEDVQKQFKDNEVLPDLIIDAGPLEPKPASTMLDLTGDKPVIIRKGANFEEVQEFLNTL